MISRTVFIFIVLLSFLPGPAAGSDKQIKVTGQFSAPCVGSAGGTAYLQVRITASEDQSAGRKPLNIAVVLDRSGSMADEGKIGFARQAVRSLIDQLQPGDYFALVIYDDVVQVLRESGIVRDKQKLRDLVDDIYPRGATNLGGGLVAGYEQVERHCDREFLNRVVLVSDGLANRGVTDTEELQGIARRFRSRSISVTTMGVGLEYNENLMMGLSQSGGGNYYFIESPGGLGPIFHQELRSMATIAAQNAILELSLADGVHLRDVIGCEQRREGKRITIPIGDLYAGEERRLTVELEIPGGHGTIEAVKGTLRYDGKHGWLDQWPAFSANIRYGRTLAEIEQSRDPVIQAQVDVALSTRNVDRAMKALDAGNRDAAMRELKSAQATVMMSPAVISEGAGGAILSNQRLKLEAFRRMITDSADLRKAKKAIQFENYQTQKR